MQWSRWRIRWKTENKGEAQWKFSSPMLFMASKDIRMLKNGGNIKIALFDCFAFQGHLIIRDVQFFAPQPSYYVKYVHSHLSIPHRVISQCYYKNNSIASGGGSQTVSHHLGIQQFNQEKTGKDDFYEILQFIVWNSSNTHFFYDYFRMNWKYTRLFQSICISLQILRKRTAELIY